MKNNKNRQRFSTEMEIMLGLNDLEFLEIKTMPRIDTSKVNIKQTQFNLIEQHQPN